MCAIVDKNVVGEVFGKSKTEAGAQFFEWINEGSGRLVVGGALMGKGELGDACIFENWARQAQLSGKMLVANKKEVENKTALLEETGACKSNDHHVIALAQVSGARLLYTNDRALQKDFKDKRLIDKPRGRVYSTLVDQKFTDTHRRLLGRRDLCAAAV